MKKIRPLGNYVLVKRSQKEKTKGGIILPDSAQEKPKEGEVIAAGPGKRNDNGQVDPLTVKVGERVLFSSYAGTEVKGEDSELLLLSEDDVLGVLS